MNIRRFKTEEAKEVSDVIRQTIRISNTKDYPLDLMEELIAFETPEHVLERAGWTHLYVAEDEGKIIGCGAIGPYWGKTDESSLFTIFVLPEYQGKGVGRSLIDVLQKDELYLRAKRVEIPASITGGEAPASRGTAAMMSPTANTTTPSRPMLSTQASSTCAMVE